VESQDDEIRRLQSMLNNDATAKTLESKVDRLTELVLKQQQSSKLSVANFSLESLHCKVDKLVRWFV
jgi:hypothetical protein